MNFLSITNYFLSENMFHIVVWKIPTIMFRLRYFQPFGYLYVKLDSL